MSKIRVEIIGPGTVTQQPLRRGLTIQLKAIPDNGARFISWEKEGGVDAGTLSGYSVCNVNPHFSGTVVAVFSGENPDETQFDTPIPRPEKSAASNMPIPRPEKSAVSNIKVEIIGLGTVTQQPLRRGLTIQLKAIPDNGARFICWEKEGGLDAGTLSGFSVCNVNPHFSGTVVAVFSGENPDETQFDIPIPRLERSAISNDKSRVWEDDPFQKHWKWLLKCNDESIFWVDDPTIQIIKKLDAYGCFIINDDGTVLDQATSLMWTYKAYPQKITLETAKRLQKDFAGYSDWRIPTLSELQTIIPKNLEFFSNKLIGYHWSDDNIETNSHFKWVIDKYGRIIPKNPNKNSEILRLVRNVKRYSVIVQIAGLGRGSVENNIIINKSDGRISKVPRFNNAYPDGTQIEFIAKPDYGSRFIQWSGDASGTNPNCTTVISKPMAVIAEFEQITHSLNLRTQGSGEGSIAASPKETLYLHDSIVTLQAVAGKGSRFKQWIGAVSGSNAATTIKMDGAKTATAEFVRLYSLMVSTQGKGLVKRSENANEYEAGTTINLTAIPTDGHEFVQWHDAAFGTNPVCTVVMDSSRSIRAEFRPLPIFDVQVTYAGTGSGVVLPNKQVFWKGSVVELIAEAAEGCVFDGWGGDLVKGLEQSRKVTVNTHLAVTAIFNRLEIPETDIAVEFDSTILDDAQNANATVLLFTVRNRSDRQIHLDIPLASFVTLRGEEVEQTAWVKGMIIGEKGVTLRAGTFRKMGLVFDRRQLAKVVLGEHLHMTILQSKPAQRLTFTFRCTDASKQILTLVKVDVQPLSAVQENSPDSGGLGAQAELTARMEMLEKSLQEALTRLSAPLTSAPQPANPPAQTLPEVLAWLCTQNSVPQAVLRQKLLPLGLMPSAVLDDVNERAFEVAGEPALEEAADNVTVQRGVLLQVLAAW